MKRSKFITLLGVAAALWPLVTQAQEPKKTPHLCFLTFDPGTMQSSPRFDVFFNSLRDLGYVDGQTIFIHYLSADEKDDRFPALASECLRVKADIIAVSTTPAAQAAKRATRTVPIVMIALGDPVATGLVESIAQPGGNVTGMSMMVPQLAVKRLELLKEAVPSISRVLVLSYLSGSSSGQSCTFARSDTICPGYPFQRGYCGSIRCWSERTRRWPHYDSRKCSPCSQPSN